MAHATELNILDTIYNDPRHPAGFSTPNVLYKHVKKHGITRKQVAEYLRSKDSYTLHKQTRRGKRNRIVVNDIDDQWELVCQTCLHLQSTMMVIGIFSVVSMY